MNSNNDEDEALLRVALQNAKIILQERQRFDRELLGERERLRITLASIGDGVISTDAEGRVTFLNGVAEELTGWTQREAAGMPLHEVFRIINEDSRQPVENPAMRAIRDGHVVGLANHTLLVSRAGTECPIDDSAAPMHDDAGRPVGAVLVFRDVTDKRRAEETQARLAAIVESSDDAIVSKSLDGIVRTWNRGAEELFGYPRAEMIGRPITVIIPPELWSEEQMILAHVRQGKRLEHFETERIAKDGRRLNISVTVSPVRDRQGRIFGVSKIGRDITGRKRAEEASRKSEGRHRFLAELAAATHPLSDPHAIMQLTAQRLAEFLDVDRCAYAEVENETVFHILGEFAREVPTMIGRWPMAHFGEEVQRSMLASEPFVIDDVQSDLRVASDRAAYEHLGIRACISIPLLRDGRLSAAMGVHQRQARPWTEQEIELVQTVVGLSRESIERTRIARGLEQTAENLSLALEAAQLGDWQWDRRTDRLHLSPRAASIFGIASETPPTWEILRTQIHKDDQDRARVAVEDSIRDHRPYDIEYRVIASDQTVRWVSARGRAQYDPAGEALGMFGVVQDVTARKQMELELRQRAEELADSDRKKDDFIALLAHELRNPLAPVRTGLEVMRLSDDDPTTIQGVRAMMERQLSHMVRIIDDLLDISRINRNKLLLQKTRVKLSDVIQHAVEVAAPLIEAAGHRLRITHPTESVELVADFTRLAQVFGNLLTNSAKYTEQGGDIWLTAVRIGDDVEVRVRDTGVGIPAASLDSIFEMFAQGEHATPRSEGGLGIGLALVQRLVQMHGGHVTAHSAGRGQGSEFVVRLPVADSSPTDLRPLDSQSVQAPGKCRRVLVVDDNLDAAEGLRILLQMLGHEVYVAHDGERAVDAAREYQPEVVLLDIGLPRMNGYEAARQMRQQSGQRPMTLVALTGWGQEGDRRRSREAGFNLHLTKPIELAALQQILSAPAEDCPASPTPS